MSPIPSRFSAPGQLMMVAESCREATWKEMRAGKFALITPVTTSVEGRWVATIRWIPAARAICARRAMYVSTSREATIMRSASSSMMMTM